MYVKLFASLYQGTLRGRPDEILVFINMLATADRHGYVDRHFLAIAQDIGLTEEAVKAAVLALEAPDPGSRSPEFSGSRIERLDEHRAWGWHILNYQRYRDVRNSDDRREQNRAAQERFRNKRKASKQQSAHADADADVKQNKVPKEPVSKAIELPTWLNTHDWHAWLTIRKSRSNTISSLKAALAKLEKWREAGHDANEILATSLANGWQGLFEPKGNSASNKGQTPSFKTIKCGNCSTPLTTSWCQSPKGRVCQPCHRGYMGKGWPA